MPPLGGWLRGGCWASEGPEPLQPHCQYAGKGALPKPSPRMAQTGLEPKPSSLASGLAHWPPSHHVQLPSCHYYKQCPPARVRKGQEPFPTGSVPVLSPLHLLLLARGLEPQSQVSRPSHPTGPAGLALPSYPTTGPTSQQRPLGPQFRTCKQAQNGGQ